MKSTGNAGGSHNIVLQHSHATLDELIQEIAQGVIVTELMGDGVNLVTGDYSQGAVGFWIEKGKIAYPIQEITIAGNLRQMLHDIIAVANDAVIWGSQCVGSILIKSMTVAGKNNI
jgi:PmbA protein